jgi:DNA-directed RNA polymerase specialized sigma24 family protein
MEETDASLVFESLKGSREAFGHIVARYQTLLCSLAYSATGSFSQSQDLSQETFVIAWKQLSELREPGKLRSWLCAILQNRIYKTRQPGARTRARRRTAGRGARIVLGRAASVRADYEQGGRGHFVAVAGKNPRYLSRTAGPVLP